MVLFVFCKTLDILTTPLVILPGAVTTSWNITFAQTVTTKNFGQWLSRKILQF